MPKQPPQPAKNADLRRRAEQRLSELRAKAVPAGSEADAQRLIHELQVHQVELEMQNEELQRARNALETALENYSDLYDFAPVGYLSLDRQGTIVGANLAAAALLGVERSRLLRRRFGTHVAADDLPGYNAFLDQVFGDGVQGFCELNLVPGDKPPKTVRIEATLAASGQECRMAVLDVTQRKQAEEDRLTLNKLESTGILAGGIAHDFNNLLMVILLDIDLLQTLNPPGEGPPSLAEAKKAALAARGLTQQLITLAKGGALLRKPTHLSGIIQESVRLPLSGSRVRCKLSLAGDLWTTEVDEGQIGQVFRNLVLNAREAMAEGGVISVRAKNLVLEAQGNSSLPPGDYVRVSVADHGSGIPEDVRAKIFDPYFSTKRRGIEKGMGLGLTICHAIIQKHGGAISVTSAVGVGTTFHVDLPASRKAPGKPAVSARAKRATPARILVMDDEEAVRNAIASALRQMGHEVELVEEGRRAIELYRNAKGEGCPFDLVLLDLTVRAGAGGMEAMQALRELDPEVKAIVMSGYSKDAVMGRPERHGFVGALAKPFASEELQEIVARAMRTDRNRRAAS